MSLATTLSTALPAVAAAALTVFTPPRLLAAPPTPPTPPSAASVGGPTALQPALKLHAGKTQLITLPEAAERVSTGHPGVVDVTLTAPRELLLLGRGVGTTNVMLWRKGAPVVALEVQVVLDAQPLRDQLQSLLPGETELRVQSAGDSLVLAGRVSSAVRADAAVQLAEGHARALQRGAHTPPPAADPASGTAPRGVPAGLNRDSNGPRVINLMQIAQPQQVMLEVKVAEVSRNLLDQFGISLDVSRTSGSVTWGLVTAGLQDVFGRLIAVGKNGSTVSVDAKVQDAGIKLLAEPTIVAMSGQEASFLAGGKVFIPVARDTSDGRSTVTLEEKPYGVGLSFTPLVLDDDIVQLRVAPEVSELSKAGSPFVATGGATSVLPSFTTRRAATTVQLRDGQSLAIAGLIKNNVTETVNKFPFLGDIPVLGALFRSTEFQTDRSELLFIITPRLVKALPPLAQLPASPAEDSAGGVPVRAARSAQTLHPDAGQERELPAGTDAATARNALQRSRQASTGASESRSAVDTAATGGTGNTGR
jgi:pilus assembly protein CpaC